VRRFPHHNFIGWFLLPDCRCLCVYVFVSSGWVGERTITTPGTWGLYTGRWIRGGWIQKEGEKGGGWGQRLGSGHWYCFVFAPCFFALRLPLVTKSQMALHWCICMGHRGVGGSFSRGFWDPKGTPHRIRHQNN